jgi:hypothetical protein
MGWGQQTQPAVGVPRPGTLGARMAEALGADIVIDLDAVDTGHLVAEHRAAVAQLERYRQALTQIAAEDFRGPEPASVRIAREALGER